MVSGVSHEPASPSRKALDSFAAPAYSTGTDQPHHDFDSTRTNVSRETFRPSAPAHSMPNNLRRNEDAKSNTQKPVSLDKSESGSVPA